MIERQALWYRVRKQLVRFVIQSAQRRIVNHASVVGDLARRVDDSTPKRVIIPQERGEDGSTYDDGDSIHSLASFVKQIHN